MPWRMYLLPLGKLAGFHSLSSLRFGGGFWTERQISENQCLMLRMFGLVWFGLVGFFYLLWWSLVHSRKMEEHCGLLPLPLAHSHGHCQPELLYFREKGKI